MAAELEIRGTGDLDRFRRAMAEAASASGIRRDLEDELKKVEEETARKMQAAIPSSLPSSGGMARTVASSTTVTATARDRGSHVEAEIKIDSRHNLKRMNDTGTFSHPVYGDTSNVVTQSAGVKKGFLDEEFKKSERDQERAAENAVDSTRAQIYRST